MYSCSAEIPYGSCDPRGLDLFIICPIKFSSPKISSIIILRWWTSLSSIEIKITPSSPKDYISRFASVLKLSPKTQNEALKILKKAELGELTSGRGPAGIAAAALYVAALLNDEKKTQREVADVAGITEVTIRNRYKELLDKLGLEEKLKVKEAEQKYAKKKAK